MRVGDWHTSNNSTFQIHTFLGLSGRRNFPATSEEGGREWERESARARARAREREREREREKEKERELVSERPSTARITLVSQYYHFRARREELKRFKGLLPESQGQNLALTVLYVPYLLDSGRGSTPLLEKR